MTGVSTFRLYVLRAMYLLVVVGLMFMVWPGVISHTSSWGHMQGVVSCMLAAVSLLAALGIRYPLQMLPVLIFELLWKVIWLLAVALPLWNADLLDAPRMKSAMECLFGVAVCLIAIPWGYVYAQYVKKTADRWRGVDARRVSA